jgi:hypothetical protein
VRLWLAIPVLLAVAACGAERKDDYRKDDRLSVARIYMGVACRQPNSIRCDRVGLAVWSPERFPQLEARIAGRPLTLKRRSATAGEVWDMPHYRRVNYYEGFLAPAGLIDGRLRAHPDGGRYHWTGRRPRAATVVLMGGDGSGKPQRAKRRVFLAAGWG